MRALNESLASFHNGQRQSVGQHSDISSREPVITESSRRRRKPPRRSPALHPRWSVQVRSSPQAARPRRRLGKFGPRARDFPGDDPDFPRQRHQLTDRLTIERPLQSLKCCFVSVEENTSRRPRLSSLADAIHVPAPVFLCL